MTTFEELNLIAPVQRAITEEKYERPTPIQAQTIPGVLSGRDVLGCAQTGTGKTAAFALPILNRLGAQNRKSIPNCPRVLVLAPTRELAVQIGDSFATYGRHLRLRQALVYGGVGQYKQVAALNKGVHILVATHGRLLDLMDQGHISLDCLEVFVLDEADSMLDMGFLPDLQRIIAALPERRQSLFFSATLPPKIRQLSNDLLSDPLSVSISPQTTSVEAIDQSVIFVERKQKQSLLKKLLKSHEVGQAIVFTRTKRGANLVAEHLIRDGIPATAIHGNKSQSAREHALNQFRRGRVQVLVATDLAARGIDIDGITHVINFEMPHEPESYVHRIGRTGRAGASGIALSFCGTDERGQLLAIERLLGRKLNVNREHSSSTPGTVDATESRNSAGTSGNHKRPKGSRKHSRPYRDRSAVAGNSSGDRKPRRRRRSRRRGERNGHKAVASVS